MTSSPRHNGSWLTCRGMREFRIHLLLEEVEAEGAKDPGGFFGSQATLPACAPGDLKLTWNNQNWHPRARGDFMVRFNELQGARWITIRFDARVYSTESMQEFVDCLAGFIRAAAKDPDVSVRSLIEADGIGDRLRKRRISNCEMMSELFRRDSDAEPTNVIVSVDMTTPKFTILLAIIRPPVFLPLAIESVLAQTVKEFELLRRM